MAVGTRSSPLPEGWQRGAFMQVFVRSYQDSDGDGIGDLRGLISRLDHLKELGIRGLWLMPIHPSQDRDHGYAVKDYRAVESQYGSLADLQALVQAAHARGIGVILDYVLNHSAGEHPAFVNARAAKDNAWRNWYLWQDTAPAGWNVFGQYPWRSDPTGWYYAPFWDQMPDFNLRNPDVVAWHEHNLRHWLNLGIDGFRFDAVGLLVENGPSAALAQPESRTLMARLRAVVEAYDRRFIVCESPDDPAGFTQACGSAFAFELSGPILRAAASGAGANADPSADLQTLTRFFLTAAPGTATFLANHDLFAGNRVWNQLGGDVAAYKLAAASYLLLPGTPFIYYGEEIGMAAANTLSGDPSLRTPMSWTGEAGRAGFTSGTPYRALSANAATQHVQAQAAQPDSILNFYRAMIGLRNTRLSLSVGGYEKPLVQGRVAGWQRSQGSERTLVLINYGAQAATVRVNDLPASAVLSTLWPQGVAQTSASFGSADLQIPARSVRVLDVK